MAFWKKKSEDPWDQKPRERKKESRPAEQVMTPPSWAPAPKEAPPPADCPWCGQPMLSGNVYGNAGRSGSASITWIEGADKSFLERIGNHGERYFALGAVNEAWYCEACGKMVLDVDAEMRKTGPNYVWKNGKVVLPEDEDS